MSWNATILGFAICTAALTAVISVCLTADRTNKRSLDGAYATARNAKYWQRQAKDQSEMVEYYRGQRDIDAVEIEVSNGEDEP